MFEKIIAFFRNLFSGFRKSRPEPTVPKSTNNTDSTSEIKEEPEEPIIETPLPEPDPELAQDGSEITPDTVVQVIEVLDPVIIPKEEDEDDPITIGGTTTPSTEDKDKDDTTDTEVGAAQPKHKAKFLWCLDNGHGKKTAGKRSPKLENGDQLLEYEFNRDIVKKIIKALDEKGVKSFNVVPEVDVDNMLEGRVKRANQKKSDLPKLFVSVHANAAPARPGKWGAASISGIETWFFHNSRKGRKLATVFQKHLVAETGWKNRFIKSRPNKQFYVLRQTNMTAVLTENGFYNNKEECKELLKDSVRQKIADAHVKAIMEVEKNGLV